MKVLDGILRVLSAIQSLIQRELVTVFQMEFPTVSAMVIHKEARFPVDNLGELMKAGVHRMGRA